MIDPMKHYVYMAHLEAMHSNLRNLNKIVEGVRLQNDIQKSFESFGLTKGTWMVLQRQPAARALFTEVPSLENLNAIGTTTYSIKPTRVSKTAVVADWLDNTADGVNDFTETALYHLQGLKKTVTDAADIIEDRDSVDGNTVIYAIPAAERLSQCAHLIKAQEHLLAGRIDDAAEHIQIVNGMCKMGYDNVPGPAGMYCVENLEEGTLNDLGYGIEELLDLADDTEELLNGAISLVSSDNGATLARELRELGSDYRKQDNTASSPSESVPITDEAEISTEMQLEESTDAVINKTNVMTCFIECVGHIALNNLGVLSKAAE